MANLVRLYSHLTIRRRWQLFVLILLMLAGAAAEMATLGSIVPVLALLAAPASAYQRPQVQFFLQLTGVAPSMLFQVTLMVFMTIILIGAAIRLTLFWVSYRFSFGIGGDIGKEVYSRTLHRSYSWHVSRNSSEILSAVEKINSVTNTVIVQLVQGAVAAVVAAAILLSLLLIDARIALGAGAGFISLYGITTALIRRRLRRNSKAVAESRTNRVRAVQEGLGGIRDVLLDGSQAIYVKRFAGFDRAMRGAQASNAFMAASPRVVMEAAGVLLILLLSIFLSGREGGLAAQVATLGALALGAQKLLPQMQQIYIAWSSVAAGRGELNDIIALLEAPLAPEFEVAQSGLPVVPIERHITKPLIAIRDLSFRYHPDSPAVLRSINLEISRGARIGFVGRTGSGKSTLIDLILGLLTPCGGSIEVDGQKLSAQNMRAWQDRICHVPQTIFLIDGNIAQNIALGVSTDRIDWGRLRECARIAQLEKFVATLDAAYETPVGERGVKLSGGQRQRIGLARALYKSGDVLVLDEATSALDNQTEQKLMAALGDLHRDRTVLMIAHRLSTIQRCDLIVLVDDGVIAGVGDWDTLIANHASFQAIAAGAAMDGSPQTEAVRWDAGAAGPLPDHRNGDGAQLASQNRS